MPQVKLSASSIAAFKACPTRYRNRYLELLVREEDTDALRQGSNWHLLQEVYRKAITPVDPESAPTYQGVPIPYVPILDPLQHAINHLNERYEHIPDNKDPFDWAVERVMLAYSFIGYLWYYQNDLFETVETEIKFALPLMQPKVRMPLPIAEVVRVGKIDRIVEWNEKRMNVEYKSTSKPLDQIWDRLKMDTQISMYALAGRDMGQDISGTLYDVWHKPGISPKFLTQADTKKFIEDGKYFDVQFRVECAVTQKLCHPPINIELYCVDGQPTETKEGKNGFAIRETPEMYGTRLLADIYTRPDFYFQRREVARTDAELRDFEQELYNIYQTMKFMTETGHFWRNESQCEATFKCEFCKICYNNIDVSHGQTPEGYKRRQPVTIGETE